MSSLVFKAVLVSGICFLSSDCDVALMASCSALTAEDGFPTLRPRRIQNQNVVHRLERRRICSGRPGAHWYRVRCFHQNLFPNFTVVNVEKPPCFLRKFSPDGRCFIAFSSDQTSLEIYEYQGCQVLTGGFVVIKINYGL